jgi:transposase
VQSLRKGPGDQKPSGVASILNLTTPLGVLGEADGEASAALLPAEPLRPHPHEDKAGTIEIALPNGARVSVDAFVNEKALSRVLRAMKAST